MTITPPPPPSEPPTVHLTAVPGESGDWWDDLYADDASSTARTVEAPAPRLPDWRRGETVELGDDQAEAEPSALNEDEDQDQDDVADSRPGRGPSVAPVAKKVLDLREDFNPRTRVLAYNLGAAGLGWLFRLPQSMGGLIADAGRESSITTALIVGAGMVLVAGQLIDRRTRGWWPPLAWIARAPLASAVLALALYAPADSLA
ncbi:hypothetical protein AB4Z54_09275 [Streptomyces sp. MCAF7]